MFNASTAGVYHEAEARWPEYQVKPARPNEQWQCDAS
jgi:hypothetical protein